jgi:hypothetical protein
MRKQRSDKKAFEITDETIREALASWLIKEGISYKEASARLQARYGIKISQAWICKHFWQKVCAPRLLKPAGEVPVIGGKAGRKLVLDLNFTGSVVIEANGQQIRLEVGQ